MPSTPHCCKVMQFRCGKASNAVLRSVVLGHHVAWLMAGVKAPVELLHHACSQIAMDLVQLDRLQPRQQTSPTEHTVCDSYDPRMITQC